MEGDDGHELQEVAQRPFGSLSKCSWRGVFHQARPRQRHAASASPPMTASPGAPGSGTVEKVTFVKLDPVVVP